MKSEHVLHTSGAVPEELVGALMTAMRAGSFEKSEKVVDSIIKGGYPATQVLQQLLVAVLAATDTPQPAMANICTRLAEADKKLADGADEYLQLLDCASCAICAFTGTSQLAAPAVM